MSGRRLLNQAVAELRLANPPSSTMGPPPPPSSPPRPRPEISPAIRILRALEARQERDRRIRFELEEAAARQSPAAAVVPPAASIQPPAPFGLRDLVDMTSGAGRGRGRENIQNTISSWAAAIVRRCITNVGC